MALLSWLFPLAGIIAIAFAEVMLATTGRASGMCALVAILFSGAGIVAGTVALCGMGRHGKRGILRPALTGVSISIPLLVIGLINGLYTVLYNAALPPPAHLLPAVHSASSRRLKDERLQFSIDIPEGFQDCPEAKQAPEVAYGFIRHSQDRQTATVLTIERINRVLLRTQRLRPAQLQTEIRGEIVPRKWRGLDIDVVVSSATDGEAIVHLYQCYVPLRPKAIRLTVAETGPQSDARALSRLVDTLLASFDGETNW